MSCLHALMGFPLLGETAQMRSRKVMSGSSNSAFCTNHIHVIIRNGLSHHGLFVILHRPLARTERGHTQDTGRINFPASGLLLLLGGTVPEPFLFCSLGYPLPLCFVGSLLTGDGSCIPCQNTPSSFGPSWLLVKLETRQCCSAILLAQNTSGSTYEA